MRATCPSVSGHHFSHIKSHFNDLKQNFKIWGYLQKRHFTKVSAATEGVRYNCEGLALTPFTDSKFSWLRHGANYFRCKRENLGPFWNLLTDFLCKSCVWLTGCEPCARPYVLTGKCSWYLAPCMVFKNSFLSIESANLGLNNTRGIWIQNKIIIKFIRLIQNRFAISIILMLFKKLPPGKFTFLTKKIWP